MYYHQYLLHSLSNKPGEDINLIQNPSFENGLDYWYNKYGLNNIFQVQSNNDCSKVGVNKTGEYSKLTLSIMIYKMENLLGHVYFIPHSGGSAN